MIQSGQELTSIFSVNDPGTGAATDADAVPTGTLFVNGVADEATVDLTNISTGLYQFSVTLPQLSEGDTVDVEISATVNSVTGAAVVWSGVAGEDVAVDGPITLSKFYRYMLAVLAGETDLPSEGVVDFLAPDGVTVRVRVTMAGGKRVAVEFDPE